MSIQHVDGALPTVRVQIPKGGLVLHAGGADCTGVFAPDGPVTILGRWRNGTPSRIIVPVRSIPVRVTGTFVCFPADYMGTISFTYVVRDSSNSSSNVTVA